jgi:uncharacterized protein DUF5659
MKYTMNNTDEKTMNLSDRPTQAYETSDLNLASYLRCRGFTIQDIVRQNGRAIFVFADSPEVRRAILEYANDGVVGVRSFCNTLRDLKGIAR